MTDAPISLYLVLCQTIGALLLWACAVYLLCKLADMLYATAAYLVNLVTLDGDARRMGLWADAQTWDEDDAEWDRVLESPEGQAKLERIAERARAYKKGAA